MTIENKPAAPQLQELLTAEGQAAFADMLGASDNLAEFIPAGAPAGDPQGDRLKLKADPIFAGVSAAGNPQAEDGNVGELEELVQVSAWRDATYLLVATILRKCGRTSITLTQKDLEATARKTTTTMEPMPDGGMKYIVRLTK